MSMLKRRLIVYAVLAGLNVVFSIGLAASRGYTGFPLDDAWIHQTYARNWAETGQLAFVIGQPSAGSTSLLWTFLISIAYRLRIDPLVWTAILATASLALSAWLLSRLADRLMPGRQGVAWAVGLACVLEWHMIWAAASGMETMLFIALALAVMERVLAGAPGWTIGLCGGLLTLTRPEGLLLIGLAAIAVLTRPSRGGPRQVLGLIACGFIVLAPGLWFNWQAGGSLFPNTFYAKQREYAELFNDMSVWLRSVVEMVIVPFAGAQLLLIPGLAIWSIAQWRTLRRAGRKMWAPIGLQSMPLIWAGAHGLIYALRLPVAYQHGRYLIPIIPIVLLYGITGTAILLRRRSDRAEGARRLMRVATLALSGAFGVVLVAFVPVGASAYASDVAIIDDEMVSVARWLNLHTPPGALIAAHDIGAIGYFTRRPLLDLAGLISPEVIPFIRDEARLQDWIQARRADYLVTFPGWYPNLTRAPSWTPVFSGGSSFSPEHLTVFKMR